MSENMNYVIVSQKIWKHLKNIYGGYLEFRRTGFDSIELYPKLACIYSSFFKGCLDYSSESLREVSSYIQISQVLLSSCQITEEELQSKIVYYKTIGMKTWEEVDDVSMLFAELTSEVLVFLVCLSEDQKEAFQKAHQRQAKSVTEVNLGDYLIFLDAKNQ